MTNYKSRNISLRNGMFNIKISEGGAGKTDLVYLQGINNFQEWPPFLDDLADDFHIYVPAHPGISDSEGLEYIDDLWDLVLFYEELIKSLGIATTVIMGHSYGGMLAAELAANFNTIVSQLILISPLGLWLDQKPIPDFFMMTPSERSKLLWNNPESSIAKSYIDDPKDHTDKVESDLENTKTLMAIGKFCWPIPDKGLRKRIHRITMPTQLIWGDSDGIVPMEYGSLFNDLIPNSSLHIINKCGHIPQFECRKEFVQITQEFLKNA